MNPTPGRTPGHGCDTRRVFLKEAVASGLALSSASVAGVASEPAGDRPAPRDDTLVGVQITPHSLFDEGIESALDMLQETAAVNTSG